ncbi:hypothetical protein [Rhodospirillum sp. A1_3_36]|uniref:hypothetical protein n=1 Tax=Rhodospirillum sp. A1_3_36 TaxID=3391666 RepID=UPI0039A47F3D
MIEPAEGADAHDVRVFLLGSVVGVLCHQRGLFALHASAVRLDGRAVMISGVSGAGKSTLSAALGQRGLPMVADDVVAIDCHAPGGAQVFPAFPVRKLTPDAMEELAIDPKGLVINRRGQPKYLVPALGGFDTMPLPLLAVYIIRRVRGRLPAGITGLEPAEAVAHLDQNIYRRGIGLKVTSPGSLFFTASALAGTVPVYLLGVREEDGLSSLGSLAETVESHARTVASK